MRTTANTTGTVDYAAAMDAVRSEALEASLAASRASGAEDYTTATLQAVALAGMAAMRKAQVIIDWTGGGELREAVRNILAARVQTLGRVLPRLMAPLEGDAPDYDLHAAESDLRAIATWTHPAYVSH